ncbi:MAG: hypothetical protein Fur0022_36640 [Anaerolineales bacterium]
MLPILRRVLIASSFLLTLGIRLYDLTDPPFDFHATRQFRSAVIARGIYYAWLPSAPEVQRARAVQQWNNERPLEPPIMEGLAALTYHLPGGEALWKARLLASVFWEAGGLALFALTREVTSHRAAWLSSLIYLFLPYGILASRSFQPDPLMVMMTLLALWRVLRWHQRRTWQNAVWAGSLAGIAILIKAVAVFPLGCVVLGLLFFDADWKQLLRTPQTWMAGVLALGPGAAYYLYGLFIAGFLQGQASQSFLPHLWFTPDYYLRWAKLAANVVGGFVILLGGVGIFFWQSKTGRVIALSWGVGYVVYGLAFPYHIITHDYYHLPLIPLISFSLAPLVARGIQWLQTRSHFLQLGLVLLVFGWVSFQLWEAGRELARKNYRSEAEEWRQFQTIIPPETSVLAMVQAYGYPLKYYGWTDATLWANQSDLALRELAGQDPQTLAEKRWAQLEGMDLFLITNFNELKRQPELQEYLTTNFGVFAEGEGYIIFDLRTPLESVP